MIAKIKVFTLTTKGKIYGLLSRHYFDKAIDLAKRGDYDGAEHCQSLASKYMTKHCDVTVQLVRGVC